MNDTVIDDKTSYELLKIVEQNPAMSQRELAAAMGISLGKLNYCLKALMKVGMIKMGNFSRSERKLGYAYILTPKGIAEKSRVTARFLVRKETEYETLKTEIAALRKEVGREIRD